MDEPVAPSIRLRLSEGGSWWGGGFQGWRDPQIFPLNEARLASNQTH